MLCGISIVEIKTHSGNVPSLPENRTWRLNMANSVEQFTDDHFEGSVSEDGGQFSFLFPDSMSPESQLLMKSLILGLTNIRDEYGAEYINFRFREV